MVAWGLCASLLCSVAQMCLTLCNPCSLPGSFVHGISQVRILEWIAISFKLLTKLEAREMSRGNMQWQKEQVMGINIYGVLASVWPCLS